MNEFRLAIFATPKPFTGPAAVHQRNAISSWQRLGRDVQVILIGNEVGTAAVARELGAHHVPNVARNERGTPLVSSIFHEATTATQTPLLCYVNADIILLSDFLPAVNRVPFPRFLMAGRRWDVPLETPIDFEASSWEADTRRWIKLHGRLHAPSGMDYFVFPRGLLERMPDFAVGRAYWDTWLVFQARALHVPVVDATASVVAVHQNHDYAHVQGGARAVWEGAESRRNRELAEDMLFPFTLEDATWELTERGVKRRVHPRRVLRLLRGEAALWLRRRDAFRRMLRTVLRARFV